MNENLENRDEKIVNMLMGSYDAFVRVFAYMVGELSKSLPNSDFMCKSANELLPTANELLSTMQKYEGYEKLISESTSQLLDELCTSDNEKFENIQRLGLLPLINKMRMYRELIMTVKRQK